MINKLYNLLDTELPSRKENKTLSNLRQSFFDRLESMKNKATAEKLQDCLEIIDDILDPALSFPNLIIRLNKYGDIVLELISFKAATDLLLKTYKIDYKLWSGEKQAEALENTAKIQMEKSGATGATVSRSEKNLDLALSRLHKNEFTFYELTLSYLETISKLLDDIINLVNQNNYNSIHLSKMLSKEEG